MATVAEYLGENPEETFGYYGGDDAGQDVESPELTTEADPTITEPVAEEAKPTEIVQAPPASTDDHYFDQLELLAKMAECERRRVEIASELAEVDEHRKDLKAQLKSCQIDMQEIASDIADLMSGTYVPKRPEAKKEGPTTGQGVEEQSTNEWGDGTWREAKTAEVMEGVKGLGKKKLEALADLAPSIGELEDLRGTSGGVFKVVLPQGFGDKVASEIEDRLIDFIAKRSTPPASEQVKLHQPLPEDYEPSPTAAEVQSYVESFRNDAEIEKWDERDCDHEQFTVEMEQGYEDRKSGKPIDQYPNDYTDGQLSDWSYGYVCREVMERIENQQAEQQSPESPIDDFSDL